MQSFRTELRRDLTRDSLAVLGALTFVGGYAAFNWHRGFQEGQESLRDQLDPLRKAQHEFGKGPELADTLCRFAHTNGQLAHLDSTSFGALTHSEVARARIAAEKQFQALAYLETLLPNETNKVQRFEPGDSVISVEALEEHRSELEGKNVNVAGKVSVAGLVERPSGPWGQATTTFRSFSLTSSNGNAVEFIRALYRGKIGTFPEAEAYHLRLMGRQSQIPAYTNAVVDLHVRDGVLFLNQIRENQ